MFRKSEYCDSETIFVQVLTWNTNGAVPIADEDYLPLISTIKGSQAIILLIFRNACTAHTRSRFPRNCTAKCNSGKT